MNFRAAALAALILVVGASDRAFANGPMIDWDPAYAWEPGATVANSIPGSEFKMVGIISGFDGPLADLDVHVPGVEYTFYIYGLLSNGTTTFGPPATEFYQTTYSGGVIEIYYDASADASFDPNPPNAGVPADFADGTLLLKGLFTSFVVNGNNFSQFQVGNIEGDVQWIGGTRFADMSPSGDPCPGLFTGGSTWRPSVLIAGYNYRHDGKLDLECPVGARVSTWGRVKSLYR